jgi:hypothetical protein
MLAMCFLYPSGRLAGLLSARSRDVKALCRTVMYLITSSGDLPERGSFVAPFENWGGAARFARTAPFPEVRIAAEGGAIESCKPR